VREGTCASYLDRLETEGVLAGIGDVQETILILVLLVDTAHESSSRWQDFIDEDEDGLLWGKLYALADDVDELANGEVGWYEVLLLIDRCNIGLLDLLADDWDSVGVLLTNSLSFGLALLEGVLILKLGPHGDGCTLVYWFIVVEMV